MLGIPRLAPHPSGRWLRLAAAVTASLGAVGLVTGAIYSLRPVAPVLSLGVLYLFAVLPVAALWGLPLALLVSLLSMTAFNWLFLPPTHTFRLADSENWVALAVYLVTAVSVSALAARARRRAAEAEQRQREAALAAQVSAVLLESREVRPQLPAIASRAAGLLGASSAAIELGPPVARADDELAFELVAGDRRVGRLVVVADKPPDREIAQRVLSMLGSLLTSAIERERLARDARESEARRRAEAIEAEALRRSDAVKTAVLRSVSHDLRSPLTAIMTASEVLVGSGAALSAAERDELLAAIRLQVRRLERFVSKLLDLSRLETGTANPVPELWTVDGLVARALEALGPENARVDVVLEHDLPPLQVDPAQVEQVLVNLLENAIKFSPPSGRIEVYAEKAAEEVVVRVADRGPGVLPAEQDRIFEPFSRGTSGDGQRGSGLGLAIARGFAQVNGGRLWVESTCGEGATFALALPATELSVRSSA